MSTPNAREFSNRCDTANISYMICAIVFLTASCYNEYNIGSLPFAAKGIIAELVAERKKQGLTQQEIADRTGMKVIRKEDSYGRRNVFFNQ